MPITLGAKPDHDFDEPLGLLSDCHRRIERFLGTLLRVAGAARGGALTPPHREALEAGLRYFRIAAPRHNADEESSLFPRLRRSSDPLAREAIAKIDALEADHRAAALAHGEVEAIGIAWLNRDAIEDADRARMIELLHTLEDLYRPHIEAEDRELFPLAGRVLAPNQIAMIGREMAERRGLRLMEASGRGRD
jgi:hemerythrin-like domain-containing protein